MPSRFGDREEETVATQGAVSRFGDGADDDGPGAGEYILNRAKKGLAGGTFGMTGLAADAGEMTARYLHNVVTNPESSMNRLLGTGSEPLKDPAPFNKTQAATKFGEELLGVDPDMKAPSSPARYTGAVAEFAAGGVLPSAWVLKAAKHKIPAFVAEVASSVGGGIGQEEFGTWGAVAGGIGLPVTGQVLYKTAAAGAPYAKAGAGRLASTAGLGETKVGAWLGADSTQAMAGRDLTGAINAAPMSGLNLRTSEQTAKDIEGLGGRVFNPTLGQRSGAEGVIALEKGIAGQSPESLGRHSQATASATTAADAAQAAAFPATASGPRNIAARGMTGMEKALDDRLAVINDAELRIGEQFPDVSLQGIGDALNKARTEAMTIAKGVKNQKYQDVYNAANAAKIGEDMSDVAALAKSIEKKNVFQNFPSVFEKISERYAVSAKTKPTVSKLLGPDGLPIKTSEPKAAPATFEEMHSLVRETGRQLRNAVKAGDSEGIYYLTQIEQMLDGKIAKYAGAEYGDVAAKLADADDFFVNKYATVFREGAGGRLAAKNRYGELIDDEKTVQRFFSPSGVDDFNEIFAGAKGATEVLEYGVLGMFARAAVKDGVVDPRAAGTWIRRHKETLSKLPNVLAKISDGRSAQEAIIAARLHVKARQKNIDRTYMARLANTENPDAMIQASLGDPQAIRGIASLAKDPKSQGVVARAVMQALPAAASKAKMEPLDFLIANADALRPLMQRIGPDHEKNLRTIASARGILSRVETPGTVTMHGVTDPIKESLGSSVNEMLNSWRGVARRTGSVHSAVGSAAGKFANTRAFKAQRALMEEALYSPKVAEDLMRALKVEKITPVITNSIGNHLLSLGYRIGAANGEDGAEP